MLCWGKVESLVFGLDVGMGKAGEWLALFCMILVCSGWNIVDIDGNRID